MKLALFSLSSFLLLAFAPTACVVKVDEDKATLHSDIRFRGIEEQFLDRNGRCHNVHDYANDQASSITCDGDITVYDDSDCRGDSRRFTCDISDLHDFGWGDRISSVRY